MNKEEYGVLLSALGASIACQRLMLVVFKSEMLLSPELATGIDEMTKILTTMCEVLDKTLKRRK